ncbi:hypothetical protein K435DRAFT_361790 [Dendrothele bispora CBS 962.96]|uniref:Uncharacterized protein n=1 Tax=Dendrothele bispora (strain CBS 962.96) TaxID=1314807 RepID=A0A4S8MHS6_DENBC|nr:hypothetical protein K435DRAFT_361790 [Dendrothele bispora CBS 962.96]
MHLPCNPVEFNLIGLSPKLPLCSPLLLWFVAAFGIVLVIRFVFARSRRCTPPVNTEKGKQTSHHQEGEGGAVEKKSASWRIFGLDHLPGVGLNAGSVLSRGVPPQQRSSRSPSPPRRGGPTFEQPVASIYQSQEPISMAKIIMSRHVRHEFIPFSPGVSFPTNYPFPHSSLSQTFRRPTPKPPRRSASLPPNRPQSMV